MSEFIILYQFTVNLIINYPKAKMSNILVLAAAAMIGLTSAQSGEITINTTSKFMIDGSRRSTIFHGVNVVYKVDPYLPSTN